LAIFIHMATLNLPSVFDYLDHVKYIREYYEARHSIDCWFSYRYIQSKTGIDPGYLFKVFMGKKPLPQNKTNALAALLGLTKRETEYFTLLVMYGQAKSNETIRRYFERMLTFREVFSRTVAVKEYVYYTKWYHAAIRQLLSCADFKGDYRSLARMTVPPISESEAKKAVALLCSLGFVKKSADGVFRVTDRFLTSGDGWQSIAIRRFQQDTIMLAHKALDTVDKDLRDISTATVTLSAEGFAEARERIRQFRRDMMELASRQERPSGAYHINIQMIPIGSLADRKRNEHR
jgi:uncharacterized protein (TIGR02147 family)